MNSIALFVMGKKGLVCLDTILNTSSVELKFVVYATDKNVENDYSDEIITLCDKRNIRYYHRELFDEKSLRDVSYYIAISWRWLIKSSLEKLIVFHDSLLPKYRGFNPLVTALINGDEEIGVTAIFANKEFDKGDVLDLEKTTIKYPIKISQAIEVISICYQNLLLKIINKISDNSLRATSQDETNATYSLWRDEEDYFIDWNSDALVLERTINALGFPYGGARTIMENKIIILEEVKLIPDLIIENRTPGKILFLENNQPTIVCKSGLLKIQRAHYFENGNDVVFNKFRTRLK
jgi:methionyl-tRNA formyltransferase